MDDIVLSKHTIWSIELTDVFAVLEFNHSFEQEQKVNSGTMIVVHDGGTWILHGEENSWVGPVADYL